MRQIRFGRLPELITLLANMPQVGLYFIDKLFATGSKASGLFVIPTIAVFQKIHRTIPDDLYWPGRNCRYPVLFSILVGNITSK